MRARSCSVPRGATIIQSLSCDYRYASLHLYLYACLAVVCCWRRVCAHGCAPSGPRRRSYMHVCDLTISPQQCWHARRPAPRSLLAVRSGDGAALANGYGVDLRNAARTWLCLPPEWSECQSNAHCQIRVGTIQLVRGELAASARLHTTRCDCREVGCGASPFG